MTNEQWNYIFFGDNEDMEALNRFFYDTPALTPEATKIKDSWIPWFDNLGFWEKNTTEVYDEARNRLHAFERANAITTEEKEQVESVITTGITTEEMEDNTKRSLSSGDFAETPFSFPWKTIGIVGAVGAAGLVFLKNNPLIKLLRG
jgi:hypothetical protein